MCLLLGCNNTGSMFSVIQYLVLLPYTSLQHCEASRHHGVSPRPHTNPGIQAAYESCACPLIYCILDTRSTHARHVNTSEMNCDIHARNRDRQKAKGSNRGPPPTLEGLYQHTFRALRWVGKFQAGARLIQGTLKTPGRICAKRLTI